MSAVECRQGQAPSGTQQLDLHFGTGLASECPRESSLVDKYIKNRSHIPLQVGAEAHLRFSVSRDSCGVGGGRHQDLAAEPEGSGKPRPSLSPQAVPGPEPLPSLVSCVGLFASHVNGVTLATENIPRRFVFCRLWAPGMWPLSALGKTFWGLIFIVLTL